MKRSSIVIGLLAFLLTTILTGCSNLPPLEEAMNDYSEIVAGDLPEDIRLTIYYLNPDILTRIPLSKDDLATFPGVVKINVNSEELASHWSLLKELNPSILHLVEKETHMNARLYYVFEVGDSNKILEVVISNIHGSVYVNGIEVEDNPIFYELIVHFLTEEGRNTLGI
mgnify:CR=1 FL=1